MALYCLLEVAIVKSRMLISLVTLVTHPHLYPLHSRQFVDFAKCLAQSYKPHQRSCAAYLHLSIPAH